MWSETFRTLPSRRRRERSSLRRFKGEGSHRFGERGHLIETNTQDALRKVSGMALDGRWFPASRFGLALLLCILLATTSGWARGEEAERITILEENDSLFFNSDKHYSQGLRISDLLAGTPTVDGLWHNAFQALGSVTPLFEPGATRRTAIFLGQSIFTPKNLSIVPPDPHDRPYAGWLYVG